MSNLRLVIFLSVVFAATAALAHPNEHPLLLQHPTMSRTQIAFAYGGDIWAVGREGGRAERIVTGTGLEKGPWFSPDGKWIAFTGDYDGNQDVYVVPASGGEPRRLTYHPDPDAATGWTPDGRVMFVSDRASYSDPLQLFTVPLSGGFPTEVPLPMVSAASFSPDGKELAYVPIFEWEPAWKGYRGGQTTPIWIVRLSDLSLEKIPRENSNDKDPMWVGDTVYFLSDRNGPATLFAYDTRTKQVREVIHNTGLDIKSASAGPGGIVYEQFGSLHIYDFATGREHAVHVEISADLPQLRPHFEKLAPEQILNADISPTGKRAVFEAHGEILTVPAEKGDVRNLTRSPGIADRNPAWSPDGKWIAYFSDRSGEYALELRDQSGLGEPRTIDLGKPPSFFYKPTWSPDSKKIAYTDTRLNLWYVDLEHPTPVKVATDLSAVRSDLSPAWSPDSRWIVYSKVLENRLHALYVYSVPSGESTQITDGMSDATSPQFDAGGKYIYFAASTDLGLSAGSGDMTSINHPVTSSVYVVVLRKDLPSPLPPESDEEKVAAAPSEAAKPNKKGEKEKGEAGKTPAKPPEVRIDFENICQRILALPIPAAQYVALAAGKEGVLYLAAAPEVVLEQPKLTVSKFDLKSRKTEPLLEGVDQFALSHDGSKMLYERAKHWFIADAEKKPEPGKGELKMSAIEIYVDPRAEWRQMYHEVWRIERDFFYSPQYHGLDLAAAEKDYSIYLPGIAGRDDLNYLFEEMTGNMTVGHMFIRGGEEPHVHKVTVGLLGADYALDHGRYRFAKIYSGENWNPGLHAPLTQPGVNVQPGEYLLAVNGRELQSTDNIYSFFLDTANKQTVLKVGPNADGSGARDVTVVPVPSERALRNLDWIEANRRKVDQMTGGRVAYVYLPNTSVQGYQNFNRYFFAQVGKQAAIIDERFNHGGLLADYIIDYLRRQPMSRAHAREGEDETEPFEAIYGPKVMLINQFSGSGGDALPWYFRKAGLGPLIGMRTWGGLIGIGGYPRLIDGGLVTAPRWAIYGLNGQWEVENHGVAPDDEVEMDPKASRDGHDPQLEKAVAVVLELLKEHPPTQYKLPPFPVYHHPLPKDP